MVRAVYIVWSGYKLPHILDDQVASWLLCWFVVVVVICLFVLPSGWLTKLTQLRPSQAGFVKERLPGMCANMFPERPHTWIMASSLFHPGASKGQQHHVTAVRPGLWALKRPSEFRSQWEEFLPVLWGCTSQSSRRTDLQPAKGEKMAGERGLQEEQWGACVRGMCVCVCVCLSNQKVELKKKKRREKGLICCAEAEQIQDLSFKQKFKRSISTRREVAGTWF